MTFYVVTIETNPLQQYFHMYCISKLVLKFCYQLCDMAMQVQ